MSKKRWPLLSAPRILDTVESWADGALLFREIGLVPNGRIDGVLVPVRYGKWIQSTVSRCPERAPFFQRLGLVALEVKISRADFLRGMKEGQFERYAEHFAGLYVVTTLNVCKTSEIPKGIGHLIVSRNSGGNLIACKRHPKWNSDARLTEDQMWRLIWRIFDIADQEKRERLQKQNRFDDRIGRMIAELVIGPVRKSMEIAQ